MKNIDPVELRGRRWGFKIAREEVTFVSQPTRKT